MEQGQGQNRNAAGQPVRVIPSDVVIPEVEPPQDRVGRYTNQLNFIRYDVFTTLSKARGVQGFRNPVDPSIVTNYYSFVKRPMDLGTIRQRILNKYYSSSRECLKDFQQMFANAYLYNMPGSEAVQNAHRMELILIRELMDMPDEEVEIESLGRYQLEALAIQQDSEATPIKHSLRLQLKKERKSPEGSARSPTVSYPPASSESSSDSGSDSDSNEDSEGPMIPMKLFQEWKSTQIAFWNKHMEMIKEQMDHFNSLDPTHVHSQEQCTSSTTPGVPLPLPKKGKPQRKKRKVDVAPANSAVASTSSGKVTKKSNKILQPKSKPMTSEEMEQLQRDIDFLFPEDRDLIIEKMDPFITAEDLDECDGLPLAKLPPHCQWEMRAMVDEKLKTTVKFEVITPPQE